MVSVYKECGPFRRWLRSGPEHPEIDTETATRVIDESLHAAMKGDDNQGAMGEWVGLLGFSQGAKMCASLLFRQQKRTEKFWEASSWLILLLCGVDGWIRTHCLA